MRGALAALVLLWAWAGAAAACPGGPMAAPTLRLTAAELRGGVAAETRAGGTTPLALCDGVPGTGNAPFEPTLVLVHDPGRARPGLEIATRGACDATLLVRTPGGRWLFDDDGGGDANARILLPRAGPGPYEIRVGSGGGRACATTLTLRSFAVAPRAHVVGPRKAYPRG